MEPRFRYGVVTPYELADALVDIRVVIDDLPIHTSVSEGLLADLQEFSKQWPPHAGVPPLAMVPQMIGDLEGMLDAFTRLPHTVSMFGNELARRMQIDAPWQIELGPADESMLLSLDDELLIMSVQQLIVSSNKRANLINQIHHNFGVLRRSFSNAS